MKTKWQWMFIPLALALVAAFFALRSPTPRTVAVRVAEQTTDATGRSHIFYELTNGTSARVEFSMARPHLEAYHDRTGWWDVSDWTAVWPMTNGNGIAQ